MSDGLDPRIEALFKAALARPAAERAAFVRTACAGDAALEGEVLSLLEADAGAGSFLAAPPVVTAPPPTFTDLRYRIVREIGRGGMASVYVAEQHEPVERTVALKVMEWRLRGAEAVRRFQVERNAIARMDHPGIAQVFDAGTTSDGRPFLAMEYVPGPAITTFCRERALSLPARIRLFVAVCRAVHHAHTKGVVHRDLKPSNVLVVEQDGRALPKLIDFGIAKASATVAAPSEGSPETGEGDLLGTLEYMSPEQAAGGAAGVDARTDVYSLGSILFELVADRLPLAIAAARTHGVARALAVIEHDEPPLASASLAALARTEPDPTRRRALLAAARLARGDLDGVIAKALEKEPRRRFDSARDLADDLERFLAHEPVTAAPPGRIGRLRKLVARHRTASVGVASVAVSLVAGLAVAIQMYREVKRQKDLVSESARQVSDELARALTFAGSLTQFTDGELANLAGGTRARVTLAERVVAEQQRVAAAAGATTANSPSLGYGYQRLGEAYAAAGRTRDALAWFERSLALRESAAAGSRDFDLRRAVGVGHWRMSDGLALAGDAARAHEHDRIAREIFRSLEAEGAFIPRDGMVYVGISCRRIADGLAALGDAAAAIAEYERAVVLFDAGLAIDPSWVPHREDRIVALRGLARAQRDVGNLEPAAAVLASVLQALDDHAEHLGATRVWTRLQRAGALAERAEVLLALGRKEAAAEEAARAVADSSALAAADALHFEARRTLAASRVALGAVHRACGNHEAARQELAAAADLLRELARQDPDRAVVTRDLAAAERALQGLANGAGDHCSGAADAGK